MLDCTELHPDTAYSQSAEQLYLTTFPEIERHTLEELYTACEHQGKNTECKWLIFKDKETFVGMAYMITYKETAFLLYLALEDQFRNMYYGTYILEYLQKRYKGKELLLLIESLRESCDNIDMRIRRRGFYLRNGMYDTGYIQPCKSHIVYDILSTSPILDKDKYMDFVAHYPLMHFMQEISR